MSARRADGNGTEHWPNDALDRIQRELAGAETPLYLVADDILRVLEAAEAVPSVNPGCPSMHEPRGGPVPRETVTTRRTEEAEPVAWAARYAGLTLEQQLARAVAALREIAELAGKPTTTDEDHYGRVVVIGAKARAAIGER